MAFALGKKLKMSQIWRGSKVTPVTLVEVSENRIRLMRKKERDGYDAVQLELGKHRREFRSKDRSNSENLKAGDVIDVSVFKEKDLVAVTGYSKGRGFQGVVKRYGFGGGPKTHGQKNRLRAPGSIGSTAPQRVTPGRRMAGHMGNEKVTVKNLEVVGVDKEKRTLLLRGAVPGARGGLLKIWKVGSKEKNAK